MFRYFDTKLKNCNNTMCVHWERETITCVCIHTRTHTYTHTHRFVCLIHYKYPIGIQMCAGLIMLNFKLCLFCVYFLWTIWQTKHEFQGTNTYADGLKLTHTHTRELHTSTLKQDILTDKIVIHDIYTDTHKSLDATECVWVFTLICLGVRCCC